MNLYYARYKRQYYEDEDWHDTCYDNQGIVVLANNIEEATEKVNACLIKAESGKYRAILVSRIKKCIGLDLRQGYDSFYIHPIN